MNNTILVEEKILWNAVRGWATAVDVALNADMILCRQFYQESAL